MDILFWSDPRPATHPMGAVLAALEAMPDVTVIHARLNDTPKGAYDVLVTWNGLHAGRDRLVPALRDKGVPVVVVERGFFDRMNYSQIDHKGFNHNASWARCFPKASKPQTPEPRGKGYVLALLQKSNDTQLWDAPFTEPGPFLAFVETSLPDGVELRVRAHPKEKYKHKGLIEGSLKEAISGARFAITINSNAGNDCIGMGCPVLCVGPSVYGYAGAGLYCPPEHLDNGIEAMLDGWVPWRAEEYLVWLRTKQYSIDELKQGRPVKDALEKALDCRNGSL